MSNNLNDIMEVLEQNAGYLTETDRDIPEDDVAVIKSSAWSHIPILRTEDSEMRFWMQNNQVQITDQHLQCSEKLTRKLVEMRRRSQTASDERRLSLRTRTSEEPNNAPPPPPPSDYHYSYQEDISIGMREMSMTQRVFEENEGSPSPSSPESDDSSSDWNPGPSSIDTTRTASESPCLHEPEVQETRRLSKTQKKKMSEDELEKRRKEANKKNSKNYNLNKKEKEQKLKREQEHARALLEHMREEDKTTDSLLRECYSYTGTVVKISNDNGISNFIDEDLFINKLKSIDSDVNRKKSDDTSLQNMAKSYQEKKQKHKAAENDKKLKQENTNTYGSRKSRALHSMNIAELQLKIARLNFERIRLTNRANLMKTVKRQMATVFNFRNAGMDYTELPPERKDRFDKLCDIFKNQERPFF